MIEDKIESLKTRLLLPLPGKEAQLKMAPSYRPFMDENGHKQLAGVTILLYNRNNSFHFPLIVRPQYNGVHSGQISLPGGRQEEYDRNLIVTALRECEEEIGVDASKMTVLGSLTNLIIPVSGFDVLPVVAYYQDSPEFKLQENEVVSVIEVPVDLLLNTGIVFEKKVDFKGNEETVPYFNIYGHTVWGATAMILSEFIQVWKESNTLYSETRFL